MFDWKIQMWIVLRAKKWMGNQAKINLANIFGENQMEFLRRVKKKIERKIIEYFYTFPYKGLIKNPWEKYWIKMFYYPIRIANENLKIEIVLAVEN